MLDVFHLKVISAFVYGVVQKLRHEFRGERVKDSSVVMKYICTVLFRVFGDSKSD